MSDPAPLRALMEARERVSEFLEFKPFTIVQGLRVLSSSDLESLLSQLSAAETRAEGAEKAFAAFDPVFSVIERMSGDYGYPAADMASDLNFSVQDVRAILRTLGVLGLATRGPWYSEDDCSLKGSGYYLTPAASKLAVDRRARAQLRTGGAS